MPFLDDTSDNPNTPARRDNVTVLIVEDYDVVRAGLQDWLSAVFDDLIFIGVKSGEEAVALSAVQPPDIVLMDVELPHMNGIEAVRRIKAIVPQANIVMVSVHEDAHYRQEARAAGACAYILKHKVGELIAVLTEICPNLRKRDC